MSSDVQCCRDIYWTCPGPKLLCSLCQHQQNHNAFGLPVRTTGCTSIWSAATVSSYLLTWMTRGWCEGIILRVSLSCKQGGKSTQVNLYLQKSTWNTGIFNFCKDSLKCVCIISYRGMVAAWKQLETAAKTETGFRDSVLKLGCFSAKKICFFIPHNVILMPQTNRTTSKELPQHKIRNWAKETLSCNVKKCNVTPDI